MSASEGKADPLATRIKLSQRECLLSPKAAVKIDSKWVKLGSAFGSQADINIVERREIQDQTEVFQFISVRPRFSYGLQGILGKRQPAANYVFRMAVSISPLWQFISTMAFLLLDRPSLKTMLIRH